MSERICKDCHHNTSYEKTQHCGKYNQWNLHLTKCEFYREPVNYKRLFDNMKKQLTKSEDTLRRELAEKEDIIDQRLKELKVHGLFIKKLHETGMSREQRQLFIAFVSDLQALTTTSKEQK